MRFLYAALLLAVTCSSALAQREPEIVIPGKPGVPVYINGIDASWGVVEGEFGLDRPNEVAPTVVYRPYLASASPQAVPGYFPADGRRPGYGRLEINPPPNRRLPPPPYFRSWSSESAPGPATEYPSYPPVSVAPIIGRGRNRSNQHGANQSHTGNNPAGENHSGQNHSGS
jgi:hypothetical protein